MFWYKVIITNDQSPHGELDRKLQQTFADLFLVFNGHRGLSIFAATSDESPVEAKKNFLFRKERIYYLCFPDELNENLLRLFKPYSPQSCPKPNGKDVRQIAGNNPITDL